MKYRHIKSREIYELLCVANKDSQRPDFPPMAVYRHPSGNIYARPLDVFIKKFEKERQR